MSTPKRTLEEIASGWLWERGLLLRRHLPSLRMLLCELVQEEREALRKRHIFGNEADGAGVYVEWRGRRYGKGPILWAVTCLSRCLNKSGEWEHEPQPSSRDDGFIARCRWTSLTEAIAAAELEERKGKR